MSARKKASRRPATCFTNADRAALEPLIVAAAVAAVRQATAHDAYAKTNAKCVANGFDVRCICKTARHRRDSSVKRANRAAKALDRAIAKLRGGK